jgi:hypothetical protein
LREPVIKPSDEIELSEEGEKFIHVVVLSGIRLISRKVYLFNELRTALSKIIILKIVVSI